MKKYSNWLMGGSLVTVILSVIGAFGTDLWLASTQWILIAAVLAIWAIYLKLN